MGRHDRLYLKSHLHTTNLKQHFEWRYRHVNYVSGNSFKVINLKILLSYKSILTCQETLVEHLLCYEYNRRATSGSCSGTVFSTSVFCFSQNIIISKKIRERIWKSSHVHCKNMQLHCQSCKVISHHFKLTPKDGDNWQRRQNMKESERQRTLKTENDG